MTARKKKRAKKSPRKAAAKKRAKAIPAGNRKPAAAAKKASASKPAESFVILLDEPDDPVDAASREDEANTVQLRRDCTIEEIEGIKQRLLTALDGHDRMIVDLGAVKGVDSAFLQLLVSLQLEAKARQGRVSLRNQSESFMQSAATLGLTEQFDER